MFWFNHRHWLFSFADGIINCQRLQPHQFKIPARLGVDDSFLLSSGDHSQFHSLLYMQILCILQLKKLFLFWHSLSNEVVNNLGTTYMASSSQDQQLCTAITTECQVLNGPTSSYSSNDFFLFYSFMMHIYIFHT